MKDVGISKIRTCFYFGNRGNPTRIPFWMRCNPNLQFLITASALRLHVPGCATVEFRGECLPVVASLDSEKLESRRSIKMDRLMY
jgi:hypothetical protein